MWRCSCLIDQLLIDAVTDGEVIEQLGLARQASLHAEIVEGRTIPVPKKAAQWRLATTRAVSGFSIRNQASGRTRAGLWARVCSAGKNRIGQAGRTPPPSVECIRRDGGAGSLSLGWLGVALSSPG